MPAMLRANRVAQLCVSCMRSTSMVLVSEWAVASSTYTTLARYLSIYLSTHLPTYP